jgi:hypothetical protein
MILEVKSYALYGINGYPVDEEIDLSNSMLGFDNIGFFKNTRRKFIKPRSTGITCF